MEVKTYRAATMHEALAMVRRELGPDAAVLHTREVRNSRLFGLIAGAAADRSHGLGGRQRPSRLPRGVPANEPACLRRRRSRRHAAGPPRVPHRRRRPKAAAEMQSKSSRLAGDGQGAVPAVAAAASRRDLPEALFRLYTELIDAEIERGSGPRTGGAGAQRVRRRRSSPTRVLLKARIARIIEAEIRVTGPIAVTPGPPAAGGPGGADRRGQDHHHRQAGGPLPAQGKTPRGADHRRHLSHRGRRAIADLRRHHRPADAGGLHAPRDARSRAARWTTSTWC